ncbi:MAG: hypothetical protein ACF8NJ_09960 [Phycisphaerales bacterium JB038]
MSDWLFVLGLIVAAVVVLAPVLMIAWLIVRSCRTGSEIRRAEAQRLTCDVPGLGEFITTDNELWLGTVENIDVLIETAGLPPDSGSVAAHRSLLDDLPKLRSRAADFLSEHDEQARLEGDPRRFGVAALELLKDGSCTLELAPPHDFGVYRVEFRDGEPVSSAYED